MRLEIAREAVRLFAAQGVAGTSVEQIAEAAGVSTRTFWRYFSTKESCVAPLLSFGADGLVRTLRAWPVERTLAGIGSHLEPGALPDWQPEHDPETTRTLVRLCWSEPGLRAVWLQANNDVEPRLVEALAERSGISPGALDTVVRAALLNAALRAAVEHWARQDADSSALDQLQDTISAALLMAVQGIDGRPGTTTTNCHG